MSKRSLAVWLLLVVVAVANGWIREAALIPTLGPTWGYLLSTLLLSAAVLVVTHLTIRWIGPRSIADAATIGAFWVVLTVAFEMGLGRLTGVSWADLLAEYDLTRGRIWILVLVATAVAPALAVRTRHVVSAGAA
jgi:hypothetical protein